MPAPRTTRDIEARNRNVVLNRNRRFQRRISVPQAAQNAGRFRPGDLQRAGRLSTPSPAPAARGRRRAGPAGPARRANGTSRPTTAQRGGLLSAARNLVNNARANRARRRANRAASRANRLRNRG